MTKGAVTDFVHCINPKVKPRPGAIGAIDEATGKFQFTNPHDALYSTASMLMTHRWVEESQSFIPLYGDEP